MATKRCALKISNLTSWLDAVNGRRSGLGEEGKQVFDWEVRNVASLLFLWWSAGPAVFTSLSWMVFILWHWHNSAAHFWLSVLHWCSTAPLKCDETHTSPLNVCACTIESISQRAENLLYVLFKLVFYTSWHKWSRPQMEEGFSPLGFNIC